MVFSSLVFAWISYIMAQCSVEVIGKSRDALLSRFMLIFSIVFLILIMITCNVLAGCILAGQNFGGYSAAVPL